ncbi:hypothetical protein M427DRAFT_30745 [Gonapodya prolifera JEL478]|uniref:Uncharacterized protein n=1 Tax=Gonapodya prolifera (strain JEL478) TaxID=1344416 RepID=A0A139AJH7_GONPJ|nr:hypothetical protein M427DRAFT_30745 [Gonapodya prolifera JEL478]|eukprot:KXS16909.1 hypothetical protein M427DRAFT_30745 [Gonapodya prolifera JEL478]
MSELPLKAGHRLNHPTQGNVPHSAETGRSIFNVPSATSAMESDSAKPNDSGPSGRAIAQSHTFGDSNSRNESIDLTRDSQIEHVPLKSAAAIAMRGMSQMQTHKLSRIEYTLFSVLHSMVTGNEVPPSLAYPLIIFEDVQLIYFSWHPGYT